MSEQTENVIKGLAARLLASRRYSEEQAGAIKEAYEKQDRRTQVDILRRAWNAPKRQAAASVIYDGEWAEKAGMLKRMLGNGILVALVGSRGTGKTQMAVECMDLATRTLEPALFRSAIEFFMLIKESYRGDGKPEREVLRDHRKPSLLVIDEVSRRSESTWENNLLFELLNQRYQDMTDTILTSNQTRQEFEATFDPALLSRMQEGGGIIECNWESFRGQ